MFCAFFAALREVCFDGFQQNLINWICGVELLFLFLFFIVCDNKIEVSFIVYLSVCVCVCVCARGWINYFSITILFIGAFVDYSHFGADNDSLWILLSFFIRF